MGKEWPGNSTNVNNLFYTYLVLLYAFLNTPLMHLLLTQLTFITLPLLSLFSAPFPSLATCKFRYIASPSGALPTSAF